MRFLMVGVVLRFVVFRGVVAVINMLVTGMLVLGRKRRACKHHQEQRHRKELAHGRILTRTRPLSAKP